MRTERLSNCGFNACAFVAKWHDSNQPIDRYATEMPLGQDWGNRTTLADIGQALARVDPRFHVEAFKSFAVHDLTDLLRVGNRSVVLHTDASGGHFVIAVAVDDASAFIVDPLAQARWVSFDAPADAGFWGRLSGAGLLVEARALGAIPGLWAVRELDVDVGRLAADKRHVTARRRLVNDGGAEPVVTLGVRGGCTCLVGVSWATAVPEPGQESEVEFTFDPTKWSVGAIEVAATIQVASSGRTRDLPIRIRGQRGEPRAASVSIVPTKMNFGCVAPSQTARCELLVVVPAGKSVGAVRAESPLSATGVGIESTNIDGVPWVVMRFEVALRVPDQGQRSGRWFGSLFVETTDGAIEVPVIAQIRP